MDAWLEPESHGEEEDYKQHEHHVKLVLVLIVSYQSQRQVCTLVTKENSKRTVWREIYAKL